MRTVTYSWLAVVFGVACAAIGWLGIAGWMAVAAVAASIAAHVAGNALGTKLREATDRDLAKTRLRQQAVALPLPRQPANLERRASLGSLVVVSAAIGGACGGIAGSIMLYRLAASSLAGAVLGGVSSAVIGGLVGFLGASFVEIVRTSIREAIRAEQTSAAGVEQP